ncbi:MAG: type II secretion system F family protein [Desulfobacteraceae bacterium]|nr:MAG: type II secretion system F family protein [Desulfobacteraceae bacterium]
MSLSEANIPFLLSVLAFAVICLIATGIITYIGNLRSRREMIRKIAAEQNEWTATEAGVPPLDLSEKATSPLMKLFHAIGLKTSPKKTPTSHQVKFKFQRAGLRGEKVPHIFWGAKLFLAASLSAAFLFAAATLFKTLDSFQTTLIALPLGLLGLILPDLWLSVRSSRRVKRIVRGFPDALDLLVVCVEAGMGLDAAIQRVGEEVAMPHPDLGDELKVLNLELRAGKARQQALRSLADRTGIEDVKSLVTLLIQTDRFGTSVAQALRIYSDSFRTARYQRAEEIAAKIATKLLFPLVLCIFPCLFVVLVGPVAIQVYRVVLGR